MKLLTNASKECEYIICLAKKRIHEGPYSGSSISSSVTSVLYKYFDRDTADEFIYGIVLQDIESKSQFEIELLFKILIFKMINLYLYNKINDIHRAEKIAKYLTIRISRHGYYKDLAIILRHPSNGFLHGGY